MIKFIETAKNITVEGQIFDREKLEALTEGDPDLANEILKIFVETTPEVLDLMNKHLQNEEWTDLNREVHKYHTQLRTISSHPIGDLVHEAEVITIKMDDLDKLPAMIAEIIEVSNNLIEELKKEL